MCVGVLVSPERISRRKIRNRVTKVDESPTLVHEVHK